MKVYIILLSICLLTNLSYSDVIHKNINSITVDYKTEETGIFVLEALFANPENPYPIELWENRENEQINIFDIAREIKSIANLKEKIFNNEDEIKRMQLFERLSQMEDIADRALIMEADKWKAEYVNELMKHIIGIRHAGISDLIPTVLDPANCIEEINHLNPCDKNGIHWTSFSNLCNLSNESASIANYMKQHRTDVEFIRTWWSNQIKSSWEGDCSAVKLFYAKQRTLDPLTYYWGRDGYKAAEDEYTLLWKQGASSDEDELICCPLGTYKEEDRIRAFTIWHAYVQEVLTKSKFHHNDPINKRVCLTRTNSLTSLSKNNITQVGKGYVIPSAAYDSFTLIKIYMEGSPTNKAIFESSVPHHRIIHLYPLIQVNLRNEEKKKLEKENKELTNFIVNNFYDKSGSLMLNLRSSSAINEAFEKLIYNQENDLKNPFKKGFPVCTISDYKSFCFKMLSNLPEILTPDNLSILLKNFFNECISDGNVGETEFVVLSGPDLPFDYFYNTTDSLTSYNKRLETGDSVCDIWPKLEDLIQIDLQEGSTDAVLFRDSKTDKKFILKQGASEDHTREEFIADLFYEIAGFTIPECRLYGTAGGPIKIVSYIEDAQPFYTAYYNADETEKQRLRNEISKGFVFDALFANFDIIDLDRGNILVKNDGQVIRANNSGCFRYRANGKFKNETQDESRKGWNPSPMALWDLRDPNINPVGAEIFFEVNIYEVAKTILHYCKENQTINRQYFSSGLLRSLTRELCNNIPELESQMEIRIENFKKVAIKALEMKAEGLSPQEADIELRKWAETEDWGTSF